MYCSRGTSHKTDFDRAISHDQVRCSFFFESLRGKERTSVLVGNARIMQQREMSCLRLQSPCILALTSAFHKWFTGAENGYSRVEKCGYIMFAIAETWRRDACARWATDLAENGIARYLYMNVTFYFAHTYHTVIRTCEMVSTFHRIKCTPKFPDLYTFAKRWHHRRV